MLIVIMEQVLFKTVAMHMENEQKGKSCLTNLVAFCDRVTTVADKGRVTDKASLDKA